MRGDKIRINVEYVAQDDEFQAWEDGYVNEFRGVVGYDITPQGAIDNLFDKLERQSIGALVKEGKNNE